MFATMSVVEMNPDVENGIAFGLGLCVRGWMINAGQRAQNCVDILGRKLGIANPDALHVKCADKKSNSKNATPLLSASSAQSEQHYLSKSQDLSPPIGKSVGAFVVLARQW
jgi:hypothetical protein